ESELKRWRRGDFFSDFEFHAIAADSGDAGATNNPVCGNVEFLSNTRTQNPGQMVSMRAHQGGTIALYFICNPSAASHILVFFATFALALRPLRSKALNRKGRKATLGARRESPEPHKSEIGILPKLRLNSDR